jgi:nucleotide-binding universal stress UspA family protein
MAVKDILVHVDDTERGKVRLDLACAIARRTDARLIGLGVTPRFSIPAFVNAEIPAQVWEAQEAEMKARLDAARAAFKRHTERAGLATEWREVSAEIDNIAHLIASHARYADLMILGQPDPERIAAGLDMDTVERVVLTSGGPVLIVPYAGAFAAVGKRAMLAWNGSRESARATHDARAVLEKGAAVTVMYVNPPGRDHDQRDMAGVDIATHLARHGYKAEAAHTVAEDMKVGDMILSRAADAGADLIVMGAYGHSRLREFVLGGATAHVLRHMTVPVLMSH